MAYALKHPHLEKTMPDDLAGEDAEEMVSPLAAHNHDWLTWQCRLMNGAIRACLFNVVSSPTGFEVGATCASWPTTQRASLDLLRFASVALEKSQSLIKTLGPKDGSDRRVECYAIPLPSNAPRHVLVVLMNTRTAADRSAVHQLVQWGSHWLELSAPVIATPESEQVSPTRDVVDRVIKKTTLRTASMELVGQVASHLSCERVSIGFPNNSGAEVYAISGLSSFDHRMQLVGRISAAMLESLEQNEIVRSNVTESCEVARQEHCEAHIDLSAEHGGACVSIPLRLEGKPIGVLTLEKVTPEPWPQATIEWCGRIAASLSPYLNLQRLKSRTPVERVSDFCTDNMRRYLSPDYARVQLGAAVSFVLLTLALVIQGEHRISAVASIEGADKQVLVAPHAGFIMSASARAGETVEAGQIIARLDDNALLVEKEKWRSELNKIDKSYAQALAISDRSELSLLQAQRAEIDAELELVNHRLDRSQLAAPFRGVVVSGDLHQMLGAPVRAGQVLFEVASMETYRLILEVDEHKIADVNAGQTGTVRLAAMPGIVYDTTLASILPVAVVSDKRNVFRLEAAFGEDSSDSQQNRLRPGMQGVAKINVGQRSLLWLWTHGLFDRLRVWLWSIGI